MTDIRVDISSWEALDHVPIGIFALRGDLTVVYWNVCLEDWSGIGRNEMLGTKIAERFPYFAELEIADRLRAVFQDGAPVVFSSQFHRHIIPRSDGEPCFQETTVTAIPAEKGDRFYALFSLQDVTDLTRRVQGYWEINKRLKQEIAERLSEIAERKKAERAVQEREQAIRAIVNSATDAIITFGEDGKIIAVNQTTEQMFGYAGNDLLGQNLSILTPQPLRQEHEEFVANYLRTRPPKIIGSGRETIGRRQDGTTFPIDLAISEHRHNTQRLFTGIIRDISERKQLQRDVLGIAEDQQRRIGQDLHDSTQQELSGLGMLARTLLDNLSKGPDEVEEGERNTLRTMASKIVDGLARAQREVQAISRGLATMRIDAEGLMDALGELASRTDDLEGVTCAFKCEQPVEAADSSTATHLYRIAQEAITNALKHGRPEYILIALESNDGQLILQVADDGAGLDSASVDNQGLGLKTMLYRANLIGASLTVKPIEAGGTLVVCQVSAEGSVR